MNFTDPFLFKKLRKSNYKCEHCGKTIDKSTCTVHTDIPIYTLLQTIESIYKEKYNKDCSSSDIEEILFFLFDKKWEDWLYVHCKTCAKITQFYDADRNTELRKHIVTTIENLATPLGARTDYIDHYDKSLLFPVKRENTRSAIGYDVNSIPFTGVDVWNAYEFSTLNEKGKPENHMLRIIYPCTSESIIESKSLKLYFNSFNNCYIGNFKDVISKDLREAINAEYVDVMEMTDNNSTVDPIDPLKEDSIECIDNLDISDFTYNYTNSLIKTEDTTNEVFPISYMSYLLKSNCRHSGLPDWGTFHMVYKPDKKSVTKESLLRYLVSFRNHKEFHEECCERIFFDLFSLLDPSVLIVWLQYTRRGGIDINPFRGYARSKEDYIRGTAGVRSLFKDNFVRDFRQ